MKKKIDFVVIIILVATIAVFSYLIYFNIKKNNQIELNATIKKIGNNYIVVVDENDTEYLLNTNNKYNVGDKINFILKNIKKDSPITGDVVKIDTISKEVVFSISDEKNDQQIENSNISEEKNKNSSNQTKIENFNQKENSNQKNENDVVEHFSNVSKQIDNTNELKQTIKDNFVLLVDFLFYDESINNITFKELTTSTKLKILNLFLKIDHKIEKKFPNYKSNISTKGNKVYGNAKNKAIELYFDITTEACKNDKELCTTAKAGLKDLKNNFSLTWDFIKEISTIGISKLKGWYEIWKEI